MDLVPLIALTAIAVVGAVVGVVVATRSGGAERREPEARGAQEQGLIRVHGEIHTGWEQTLIGLIRELRLPRSPDDVPYGGFFLESRSEHRMYVRSRSEIGRGFLGAIDILPRRGPTGVRYAILRLPGDDRLHAKVLDFELELVAAMRRVDARADVQLAASALQEVDRVRSSPSA